MCLNPVLKTSECLVFAVINSASSFQGAFRIRTGDAHEVGGLSVNVRQSLSSHGSSRAQVSSLHAAGQQCFLPVFFADVLPAVSAESSIL